MDCVSFTLLCSRVKLTLKQLLIASCQSWYIFVKRAIKMQTTTIPTWSLSLFLRLKWFTSCFLVFRIFVGICGVCCSAGLDTERNFTRQYSVQQSHGFCTLRKRTWLVCFETWPGNSSCWWLHRNWRASMFFCFFSKALGFSTDLPQSKRASEH